MITDEDIATITNNIKEAQLQLIALEQYFRQSLKRCNTLLKLCNERLEKSYLMYLDSKTVGDSK